MFDNPGGEDQRSEADPPSGKVISQLRWSPRRESARLLEGFRRLHKCVRRVTIFITFEEDLGSDHPLAVEKKRPWVRHALRLAFSGFVKDVIGVDRLAFRIRQEGESNVCLIGKLFEDRGVVIADAHDLNAGVFQ